MKNQPKECCQNPKNRREEKDGSSEYSRCQVCKCRHFGMKCEGAVLFAKGSELK